MANFLTPIEALKFSGAGMSFPRRLLCEAIPTVEEDLFGNCFGHDLYVFLQGKLTEIPENIEEWQPDFFYNDGAFVYRDDVIFESTIGSNSIDPLLCTTEWTAVQKFTDANANTLWEKYLRKILALLTHQSALPYATHQSGANGLVIQGADHTGRRAATTQELTQLAKMIGIDAEKVRGNMERWLNLNYKNFTGWPVPKCCENHKINLPNVPGRRRWNFDVAG